jgi:hypothetical protein
MKEIDFLPEWYKNGQRRQVSYRAQYIALGGVLLVMVVWNSIATRSISKARGQFAQMVTKQTEAECLSAELASFKSELSELQKKMEFVKEIDSKIDVASVLAEMSYLFDEKIILSKVTLAAEKFKDKREGKLSPHAGTIIRAVQTKFSENREQPLGDVRFKVTIGGVAVDSSDVAALICQLEDSPYFIQVVPSFSRTAEINVTSGVSLPLRQKNPNIKDNVRQAEGNIQVSEFEISCYLANYREQQKGEKQ